MCGSDVQSNSEAMVKLCDEKMEMSNWAVCATRNEGTQSQGGPFMGRSARRAGRCLGRIRWKRRLSGRKL